MADFVGDKNLEAEALMQQIDILRHCWQQLEVDE
jgi:hypothetical protein